MNFNSTKTIRPSPRKQPLSHKYPHFALFIFSLWEPWAHDLAMPCWWGLTRLKQLYMSAKSWAHLILCFFFWWKREYSLYRCRRAAFYCGLRYHLSFSYWQPHPTSIRISAPIWTLSHNAETKDFARRLTSHPVRGWTGKNKAFCSPRTQNDRRVIKVYWRLQWIASEKRGWLEWRSNDNFAKRKLTQFIAQPVIHKGLFCLTPLIN